MFKSTGTPPDLQKYRTPPDVQKYQTPPDVQKYRNSDFEDSKIKYTP
jgi:hypothetical protein